MLVKTASALVSAAGGSGAGDASAQGDFEPSPLESLTPRWRAASLLAVAAVEPLGVRLAFACGRCTLALGWLPTSEVSVYAAFSA